MTKPRKTKDIKKSDEHAGPTSVAFIEQLKRQWVSTVDALVDPLMIVDESYRIRQANKSTAATANEAITAVKGKICYEVFAKRKSPCPGCKLKESITNRKVQTFSLQGIQNDSVYEVTSQPLINDDGSIEGAVHTYRDRTAEHRLREQLLQSEKLSSIGLLAGGVAHEINNPLGGILVFAQMLARELPKQSPHLNDVTEIIHAAQRCKGIVEQLLDFARTSKATPVGDLSPINIEDAIKTALRFGRIALPASLVTVEENWNAASALVRADKNQLIQVVLNLIQNAVQAMPEGGTLSLRTYLSSNEYGDFINLDVRDTGIGIPKSNLQKIFDPFFTTKEPGQGTGLGLSICYGIVKDLKGDLVVKSKVDEGSTFTLSLPLTNAVDELTRPRKKGA